MGEDKLDVVEGEGTALNVPLLGDKQVTSRGGDRVDREVEKGDLKASYLPAWAEQTKQLLSNELLGMDDTEKLELLSEHEIKVQRSRKRKFWALLAIPFLLLTAYGVWAVATGVKDSETWRESFRWRKNVHEIRQTGREQYLLGAGKADITG